MEKMNCVKVFFLKALLCALPALSVYAGADGVTLYGSVIASQNMSKDKVGIYSFNTTQGAVLTPVRLLPELVSQGGGVYDGSKYYSIHINDMNQKRLHVFDADTWEELYSCEMANAALGMAYDPTTQRIYGCFIDNGIKLGILLPEVGKYEYVADVMMYTSVMMCDNQGQLYFIGQDGMLYKLDKTNGEITAVGNTGVMPQFAQSAAVDPVTGTCYWASLQADYTSVLYEVDLHTAQLKRVFDFTGEEEITGLFIKPRPADGAPAMVENFKVSFNNGSTTGKVAFTMPVKTYGGENLIGELEYKLLCNEELYTGKAQAGVPIELDLSLETGLYKFVLVVKNMAGEGEKAVITQYVGVDRPAAVSGLYLERLAAEKVKLSWNAPDEGAEGGYIDGDALKYKIVRYPGNVTVQESYVGTSFIEEVNVPKLAKYWYVVTPLTGSLSGVETSSNKVILGSGHELPYKADFSSTSAFGLYTVEDNNADGIGWEQNLVAGCANYPGGGEVETDEWLITPPVKLTTEGFYKLSFRVRCNSFDTHRLKVMLGSFPVHASLTTMLLEPVNVSTLFQTQVLEARFYVSEAGDYFAGIHLLSEAGAGSFDLDNLKVEQIASVNAPGVVTDLQVKPADKGLLKASVSFKTPEKTIGGSALTELTKVELYRGEELIHTFENGVKPGGVLFYEDNAPVNGFNDYKVVAYNQEGNGDDLICTTYIGVDVPNVVRNLQLDEIADGVVKISWETPLSGKNGGYVDVEKLNYMVMRNGWFQLEPAEGELAVVDSITDLKGMQRNTYYLVKAVSEIGEGEELSSDIMIVGKPFELPVLESFPQGKAAREEWSNNPPTGNSSWMVTSPYATPAQDDDMGLVAFNTIDDLSTRVSFVSPKIRMDNTVKPKLIFWCWHEQLAENLEVEVYDNSGEYKVIRTIRLDENEDQWMKYEVDLSEFKDEPYIRLGFAAEKINKNAALYLDNIQVIDDLQHNMALVKVEGPMKLNVGETARLSAEVTNVGLQKAGGYTVDFFNGGELIATGNGQDIEPGQTLKVSIEVKAQVKDLYTMKLYAVVNYEADENLLNNKSEEVTIPVVPPVYPVVDDLKAESKDEKPLLTWSAPDLSGLKPLAVKDDFESYESFTVTDLGDWTLVDVDKNEFTMEFQNSKHEFVSYPNSGGAMSFQLIDMSQIDKLTEADGWLSVSGNKFLLCPYAAGGNDDWLISPELFSGGQTVTLKAKSLNEGNYGLESFTLLYSSTDKELTSFKEVKTVTDVPMDWTEYAFELPEDAKYFAIRVVDAWAALFLDDVSFIPSNAKPLELVVEGYNIYRDGEKLNENPVKETSYVDETATVDVEYTYKVTVMYDLGESDYSNEVKLTNSSGIDVKTVEDVHVVARRGQLKIWNGAASPISVMAVDGSLLYHSEGETDVTVALLSGCYVVKVGNTVVKVLVP